VTPSTGALAGVRVIGVTTVALAPLWSRTQGDPGADVIEVRGRTERFGLDIVQKFVAGGAARGRGQSPAAMDPTGFRLQSTRRSKWRSLSILGIYHSYLCRRE